MLQAHARKKAFYAFGTSKIFERRSRRLGRLRNVITYLGIVVPLLVGASAMSFDTVFLPYVLVPAGAIILVQLAASAWSLVARWDERYVYAVASMQANTKLFNAWDAIAARPPTDLKAQVQVLDAQDQWQEQGDLAQHLTDKEKRFAMRSSLFQFSLACETCHIKPASMKPGICDLCGNF